MDRRQFLAAASAAAVTDRPAATAFQIACMTLPYSRFPLARALAGIQAAGFRYVAWGVTHKEDGKDVPVLAADAPPAAAAELGKRCRGLGLEPLLLFSTVYPEHPTAVAVLTHRIQQAAAAGVPQVLTFGHTKGGHRKLWVERFKQLGPVAADQNVTLVIKQHGGETGTGAACAAVVREVGHPHVQVNYDAGNVLDYLNADPIPDIRACVDTVRSLCIKDHRNWPADEDCGPGYGEIDHYRLLDAVKALGRPLPLACENISVPLLPPPTDPARLDALARRAREFLTDVIAGLQRG